MNQYNIIMETRVNSMIYVKRLIILFSLLFVNQVFNGQNTFDESKNYIYKTIPTKEVKAEDLNSLNTDDKLEVVNYYDGYGKVVRNIEIKGSSNENDIVHFYEYNELGQSLTNYLPFTIENNNGDFLNNPYSSLLNFYQNEPNIAHSEFPYVENKYENFVGGNLIEASAPGEAWQMDGGNTIKSNVKFNSESDNAIVWEISNETGMPIVQKTIPEHIDYGSVSNEIESTLLAYEGFEEDGSSVGNISFDPSSIVGISSSGDLGYHLTNQESYISVELEDLVGSLDENEEIHLVYKIRGESIPIISNNTPIVNNSGYNGPLNVFREGVSFFSDLGTIVMGQTQQYQCDPVCPPDGGPLLLDDQPGPGLPGPLPCPEGMEYPWPCNNPPSVYDVYIDEIYIYKVKYITDYDDGLVAFQNFTDDGSSFGEFTYEELNVGTGFLTLTIEDPEITISGLNPTKRYLLTSDIIGIYAYVIGFGNIEHTVIEGQSSYTIKKGGPGYSEPKITNLKVHELNEPAKVAKIGFEPHDIGSYESNGEITNYHISTPPKSGSKFIVLESLETLVFNDFNTGNKIIEFWGRGYGAIEINVNGTSAFFNVVSNEWRKYEFETGASEIVFKTVGGAIYIDDLIIYEDVPSFVSDFEFGYYTVSEFSNINSYYTDIYQYKNGLNAYEGNYFAELEDNVLSYDHFFINNLNPESSYLLVFKSAGDAGSSIIINDEERNTTIEWSSNYVFLNSIQGIDIYSNNGNSYIDDVKIYIVDPNDDPMYTESYDPGMLQILTVIDEQGGLTKEYYNRIGNKVLERRMVIENEFIETYYVYDDIGRLKSIIPPIAMEEMNSNGNFDISAVYTDYVYYYNYDTKNRLIEKKLPGSNDYHEYIYNRLDQIVMSRNPTEKLNDNSWSFFKYDVLGRPIMSGINEPTSYNGEIEYRIGLGLGIFVVSNDRHSIQSLIESNIFPLWEYRNEDYFGYSAQSFPTFSNSLEVKNSTNSVYYYDDYDYDLNGVDDILFNGFNFVPVNHTGLINSEASKRTKGLIVGSKTKVLKNIPGNENYIDISLFYDEYQSVIQSKSNSLLGGLEQSNIGYDFFRNIIYTEVIHEVPIEILHVNGIDNVHDHVLNWYEYDHSNRIINTYQQMKETYEYDMRIFVEEDEKVLLSNNVYNELGQLKEKNIHSSSSGNFLQSVDYSYNIRGWLTHINNASLTDDSQLYEEVNWNTNSVPTTVNLSSININAQNFTDRNGVSTVRVFFNGINTVNSESDYSESSSKKGGESTQNTFDAYNLIVGNSILLDMDDYSLDQGYSLENLISYAQNLLNQAFIGIGIDNDEAIINLNNDLAAFISYSYGNIYFNNDNTDLWGMEIKYNNPEQFSSGVPQYNGGISETIWKSVNNPNIRGYGFTYDKLNRIKNGKYAEKDAGVWDYNTGAFNLDEVDYDSQGNILSIKRNGLNDNNYNSMDELSYTYNGNKVAEINDAIPNTSNPHFNQFNPNNGITGGAHFEYDSNGNLIKDKHKEIISISYNKFNLPTEIEFENNRSIQYIYDASGLKLQKRVSDNGSVIDTYYMGLFQYDSGNLSFIPHAEGRLVRIAPIASSPRDGNFRYEYNYTDHLGNLRLTYSDIDFDNSIEPLSEVLQEVNYYPFGLEHSYISSELPQLIGEEGMYKFNGKDVQSEFNLNWMDFGARMYDPSVGRWWVMDPVSSWAADITPYRFGFNNPLSYLDPNGFWESSNNGKKLSTSDQADIERFISFLQFENEALGNEANIDQVVNFVKGEIDPNTLGASSNGGALVTGINITNFSGKWNPQQSSVDRTWHEVQGNLTPHALDPRTVNQNIIGSYPGPNNPLKYNGAYDYSYVPKSVMEYPAIGHDRRYDNLKVDGLSGLLFDTRAIGADWKFVQEEMLIASTPGFSMGTRMRAFTAGAVLGTLSSFKTIVALRAPYGTALAKLNFEKSNHNVNNKPTKPIKAN